MMTRILFCVAIVQTGCTTSSLTQDELNEFVRDPANGLVSRVDKGSLVLEVLYYPKDLVKAREISDMDSLDEKNRLIANIDSLEYFILRLSRKGQEIESALAGSPALYNSAVTYLSSEMRSDVTMRNNHETITAIDVLYAGSFGMAQATSVMCVFDTNFDSCTGDVIIYFNDRQLGRGHNEFAFDSDDLKSIPKLRAK